ncbi:MAG: dimethylarginine dimethylaminohydrolase family protein [Vulcanimicrobiaceae bacterium]
MTTLLMCAPINFAVAYDINPWMTRNVGVPTVDARRQWQRLVDMLHDAGDVRIELVEPSPAVPDLVFTANAALISGRLAIVSTFRYAQRRREEQLYRERLAGLGFKTTALESAFFEGAGDALFDRRLPLLYVGHGWRTDACAVATIGEIVGVATLPLHLVDPRFYHLDTCLCPLGSGHVMAYVEAFSPQAQVALRTAVGPEFLIEVSRSDALDFACNAVEVNGTIVLHGATYALRDRLRDAGYRVIATDLSDFHRSGGSSKCLTLKLEDGPAQAQAAA